MIKTTTSREEKDKLESEGWILRGYTVAENDAATIETFTLEKTITEAAKDILEQVKDIPAVVKKRGRPAKQ